MANGDDQTLIKIAVFGITFSIIATLGLSLLFVENNGYDYDTINAYRDDLIDFSGESMLNQTPWVLEHVYTPWVPSMGTSGHIDNQGWLYGEEITTDDYSGGLNQSANIRLDPNQKSTVPISVSDETVSYEYADGLKWWADSDLVGIWGAMVTHYIAAKTGADVNTYATDDASIYNFTGWRYQFLPTLPFSTATEDNPNNTSTENGALSIVWYTYNNQEGISGALEIFGGSVLLASYSASDIVSDYNTVSGYASTYDFNFNGTMLTLSIKFDQDAIDGGTPLMSAFSTGAWTMAISSLSAGNFYDLDDGVSFSSTAGSMVSTFISIYTFDMPNVSNPWAKTVMWLMVGLPMTLAMLCVTLRLVSSVRVI